MNFIIFEINSSMKSSALYLISNILKQTSAVFRELFHICKNILFDFNVPSANGSARAGEINSFRIRA